MQTFSNDQKLPKAREIIIESLEELFWTIYRQDDDLEWLKGQMTNVFPADLVTDMETSVRIHVDHFKKLVPSKTNDDVWIRFQMDSLATAILTTHPELPDVFFKSSK